MTRYREQVARAIAAIDVTSPSTFRWFGRAAPPLPRDLVAAFPPAVAREHLVTTMEKELYESFYCQGDPVPENPLAGLSGAPDRSFVARLSQANGGSGGWSPGWRIDRVAARALVVERDGLHVRVEASACLPAAGHRIGGIVNLPRAKDHATAAPGFYTVLGDAPHAIGDDDVEVRVYFHLTPGGAAPLIAAATRELNRDDVPFRLKVANHPEGYVRCDAGVLYLRQDDFARGREHLPALAAACGPYLRSGAPAFTKPLAAGIAVAEHRATSGISFGTTRCRLVAEGIVDGSGDGVDAVARHFAANGVDIDVPYLAPGSVDTYGVV